MAGGGQYGLDKGYKSASALGSAASGPDLATSYDYFVCVVISGTAGDTVTLATTAGANVLGVAQSRVVTADINKQLVDIRLNGITKVIAGGTVVFGDQVQNDTAGKAVVSSTAGDRVFGTALTGGVVGDVIDVLLTPGGQVGIA
jgi:hypothetical protein